MVNQPGLLMTTLLPKMPTRLTITLPMVNQRVTTLATKERLAKPTTPEV